MKTLFISSAGVTKRLIILFLGWGFPAEKFLHLRKSGYDILLVSDYLDFDGAILEQRILDIAKEKSAGAELVQATLYKEYVVVGWSFGVRIATEFISNSSLKDKITLCLAVNGTPAHIHDSQGIPEHIFNGTLDALSPVNLSKFHLRCAGNKDTFLRYTYQDLTPDSFAALKKELEFFGKLPGDSVRFWDKAIIGGRDRIFPPQNQRNAWDEIDIYEEPEMNHLPEFQSILDRYIVDKSKVSTRFDTTSESYTSNAIVQRRVASHLFELVKPYLPQAQDSAELGYGDGTFTRLCLRLLAGNLALYDIKLSPDVVENLEYIAAKADVNLEFYREDVETVEFNRQYDMILSSSMLQWVNSPSRVLARCGGKLKPGGILGFAFYGPGTLHEISDVTGNGLKYPSLPPLCRVVEQMGLEIVAAQEERQLLTFPGPAEALRHLKLTGVNALPTATPPGVIRQLIAQWPKNERGDATLTFECKYLIARAR